MKRLIMLLALVALVASQAFAVEFDGGDLQLVSEVPLSAAGKAAPSFAPAASNVEYFNLVTFQSSWILNGGAALQGANTITRLLADDITPTGANAGLDVFQFQFTVVNLNTAPVTFRPLARFWFADGAGGAPGTYYNVPAPVGYNFNPVAVPGLTLAIFTANPAVGTFTMPGTTFWAALSFDNNNGATGAAAGQLNNLGQGLFDPPTVGTSTDQVFLTNAAGSFDVVNNPAGTLGNVGGNPLANLGWSFTVDAPVAVQATEWSTIKRLYR